MLPESKGDFPKLLYLNQNKWIDLSRAHYGHPAGGPFRDALAAVRKAVEAGKLVVPFSAVNMVEMEAERRPERRERLARFMVDLSCNCTILPFMPIRCWEIRNAVHAFYGRPEPGSIRPSIVRKGLENALAMRLRISGLSKEVETTALQHANSAETSVQFLLASGDRRESTDELRTEEATILAIQENVRARSAADEIAPDQRWVAELFDHIRRGEVGTALTAALQETDVSLPAFFDRFASAAEFVNFFAGVPSLDVMLTLTLARDRDLVRSIKQNDTRDLIWLEVAVPYSNLVVSENHFGHLVRASRLDVKYRTTVITNACELPALLTEMRCL